MSVIDPRSDHQPRVRRRARLVSWWLAPLVLVSLAGWLLFNTVFCMGGNARPWTIWLCNRSDWLPNTLGLILMAALIWFGLALHELGKLTGGDANSVGRTRVVRQASNLRHAYRVLDDEHR